MHLSPVTGMIGEARVRDEEGIRSAIAARPGEDIFRTVSECENNYIRLMASISSFMICPSCMGQKPGASGGFVTRSCLLLSMC
jgi:hypothetical protein